MTTGRFVWHELHTRDRAAALAFYRGLLGWEHRETPRGDVCSLDGREVAGVTASRAPLHVPSFWLPYAGVEDVDAKTAEAKSLGARVLREPADTPSLASAIARFAILVDPRGALFGLCTSAPPEADRAPREGSFCWDTLLTDDADAAAEFYAELLSASVETRDIGAMGTYRLLVRAGRQLAGVMKHPENAHPHWTPYIAVRDVDTSTRQAKEIGGTVPLPARDIPGFGRFSGVDDPTGAGVCLFRAAEWKAP